jgi:hypothetical protein
MFSRASLRDQTFRQAVTQHQQAMGDVQKKLQELSESYQALQGGGKL